MTVSYREKQLPKLDCGFNRSTQQIDEIVQLVFRSLVFSSGVP
jgi:hypothetical protein